MRLRSHPSQNGNLWVLSVSCGLIFGGEVRWEFRWALCASLIFISFGKFCKFIYITGVSLARKLAFSCVNLGGFQAHSKTGWFSWVFTHPKTFRHGRFSSGAGPLPEPRAARNSAFAHHSFGPSDAPQPHSTTTPAAEPQPARVFSRPSEPFP